MGRPKGIPHTEIWKKVHSEQMKGNAYSSKPRLWNLEKLPEAVKNSNSWTELFALLGIKGSGNPSPKRWIEKLGLSTKHFTNDWMSKYKLGIDEIFCLNSKHYWASRRRFYTGTPDICMVCGQGPVWNGKPLRFAIDHKNGNAKDCRWNNLQKICHNCHSQTETYCGRNQVKTDGNREMLNGDTIWCNSCRRWLLPNEFGERKNNPNGKDSYCIECRKRCRDRRR